MRRKLAALVLASGLGVGAMAVPASANHYDLAARCFLDFGGHVVFGADGEPKACAQFVNGQFRFIRF